MHAPRFLLVIADMIIRLFFSKKMQTPPVGGV
jgi:hypothetical protein